MDPLATIPLQGVTPDALALQAEIPLEDARRIVAQIHRGEDPATPNAGIRRTSREAVLRRGHVPSLAIVTERRSALDPFVKVAMRTHDGHVVEAVRIPLEHAGRHSVCVSSQVGCALGCAFCATGRMGLSRNLEAWEIVEQVRVVRAGLPAGGRVHGIVFQGMGEPLANVDRVLDAIRVLTDPCAVAVDARAITVCTAGLPSGMRRLAREAPRVRLGLSIGSARPDVRRRLMPIDRSHALGEEIFEAACEHAIETGLAPMWAVTLLAGVNDAPGDAEALADLALRFRARTAKSARISVIPYNRIAEAGDPFARASEDVEARFRDALRARGIFTHKRYSGGSDVAAACGQLAARA